MDKVVAALEENNYKVTIDKKDLGYKGNIQEFEERLGRGERIVLIISDKFLKSPHCMYELLKISDSGDVYERIFPIVCKDAKIYKKSDQVEYLN
ncbi:MAG: toll/interleukin-1 receptor domain-containing protein, partial [Alphaproteobacteria bacterium]